MNCDSARTRSLDELASRKLEPRAVPETLQLAIDHFAVLRERGSVVRTTLIDDEEASARPEDCDWLSAGDAHSKPTDRGHLVDVGGENIYSREVERALGEHPDVARVAVIGVPDEQWEEAVKAIIVLEPGSVASESELVEHCARRIASYKKPRSIAFVDDLRPRS